MPTLIHRRVREAQAGRNQTVIGRAPSGWVVLGELQRLRGYCLLLPDPVVGDLHELAWPERLRFLEDMARLGEAVLRVTGAARINYELLGNAEPALHAHVFPRYPDEPDELRRRAVWFYGEAAERVPFDLERDRPLMRRIADELRALGLQLDPRC